MDASSLLGILALSFVSGLLIGAVGIGGVILVPALTLIGGISIHTAVPAAIAAYLVSGAIGTRAYWRAGSVPWSLARPLALSAMPAALLGAIASGAAPSSVIETCIAVLTLASGVNAWVERADSNHGVLNTPRPGQLAVVGAVTGFVSALTGTGGPLVLVPILMWLRCPVLAAIGMAQVIQLPIALLATVGNLWTGSIEAALANTLALGLAAGTWWGARLAHAVPQVALRRVVAGVLLLTGIAIVFKIAMRVLA